MSRLTDRRTTLTIAGGAVALVAGLVGALLLSAQGKGEKSAPPPASQGGLVVDVGPADDRLDPARGLRCFVAGRFVGEMTLAKCAERNGVATGSLDVGTDGTGALAAADRAGTVLTPLPPQPVTTLGPAASPPPPTAPAAPTADCWKYAGEWRRLPVDQTLGACVQSLFSGRCEKAGSASYGRWGQQTLRLVPGRVEVSSDNRSFKTLAEQAANCAIAPVG
jgi:hypothetical protein